MFAFAALVIVDCAEPFAHALIATGTQLGIDQFLLVQWLAPLASEAPEFIVAILFALRGKGADAIGTLISSKVNQWTLLVGSLPLAYFAGGGTAALSLDGRQVEEFLLTATQTLLGVAALLALRFPRWAAWTLLGLFAVQFAVPGHAARYVLAGIYAVLTLVALVNNRRHILPTLAAPFRRRAEQEATGTSDQVATTHRGASDASLLDAAHAVSRRVALAPYGFRSRNEQVRGGVTSTAPSRPAADEPVVGPHHHLSAPQPRLRGRGRPRG
ncbi:sodium/calcium exchanger protein [Amycolatopsis tucumanensis]|uniref:Sodium/calcium exchanger membrane region domain-containing protein n=1 Tax=Amycolatopsis tucumanensis TaxID=401106 RepID=A0ABP7JX24_9PSEU|nr:sodium/calcium exchanger protein [Amycolatopsis tucumanensis]MCF6427661.1 sodium/calcium exchanger protein [Amycolatopsis tucumanensis]